MAKCDICGKGVISALRFPILIEDPTRCGKRTLNLSESRLMVEPRECTYVLPAYVQAL